MSRSIHDTWGEMERVKASEWADPEIPEALLAELRQNGQNQLAIREGERQRRRRGDMAPPHVDPARLPILTFDEGPHVFHPADEEDVRAILERLPPGSLDGLTAVELRLDGRPFRGEEAVRNPYTGGVAHESLPGVFGTQVSGTYSIRAACIHLYAYHCDVAALGPLTLYFKVYKLCTLLHEVAHHFDFTFRMGGDRWHGGRLEKQEERARAVQRQQTSEIVIPYVRERYPLEWEALARWINTHGGARLPLDSLLDDDNARGSLRGPLLSLAAAVLRGAEPDTARATFARALHFRRQDGAAEEILRRVLARRPDHPGALATYACVIQCRDSDYAAGEAMCRRAIAADPGSGDAWMVLTRCFTLQKRWQDVAQVCEDGLARVDAESADHRWLHELLVEARLHLADWSQAELDIARLRRVSESSARLADVQLAIARCLAERWDEAHHMASRLLTIGKYEEWTTLLRVVRFESAHRRDRPAEAGYIDAQSLEELAREGFFEWAERVRPLLHRTEWPER